MVEYLIGTLVVMGIIALYMLTFLLNNKTEAPDGNNKIDAIKCGACSNYTCGVKQQFSEER